MALLTSYLFDAPRTGAFVRGAAVSRLLAQCMVSKLAHRFPRREASARRLLGLARHRPVRAATKLAAVMAAIAAPVHAAPTETLVPLLRQPMPNLPGKTLTAITVMFPPGAVSAPHRHGDAFLYAYVLEGTVRSQIEGQSEHLFKTGESWTEKPADHHVLTANPSKTEIARLLVVFVANTGAQLKIDDPRATARIR